MRENEVAKKRMYIKKLVYENEKELKERENIKGFAKKTQIVSRLKKAKWKKSQIKKKNWKPKLSEIWFILYKGKGGQK